MGNRLIFLYLVLLRRGVEHHQMTNWIIPGLSYTVVEPSIEIDQDRTLKNEFKYYQQDFLSQPHSLFFGEDENGEIVAIVAVSKKTERIFDNAISRYFSVGDVNRAILMDKYDDYLFHMSVPSRKDFSKSVKDLLKNSNVGNIDLYQAKNTKAKAEVAEFENMHSRNITQMQVAVLYVTGNETSMKEIFDNQPSQDSPFWEFMDMMAERVVLSGWTKSRGDLDPNSGDQSYFQEWKDRSVMFHLAPLMNADQHRRNIGNDMTFLIYFDNAHDDLDTSIFELGSVPHIFAVVRPAEGPEPHSYRIGGFTRDNVPPFHPLPPPPNDVFHIRFVREFVYTYLHNGLATAKTLPPMCNLFIKPKAAALNELGHKYKNAGSDRETADTSETLTVQILRGDNLIAKDSSGTSDPFVSVSLLSDKYKTKTIYKTLNPVWENEVFQFAVGGIDPLNEILFKVFYPPQS
eukprot:TRINITY_DN4402_c0_g1_i3.p1 TRINITY_DN4402_c0_g1~~TRINITY_DN4402_c0_g1_i3.p1  ORF type:complete len:460 (-),score=93.49 TRINITY_DN4402_c0_g1_i3:211-1590(-)